MYGVDHRREKALKSEVGFSVRAHDRIHRPSELRSRKLRASCQYSLVTTAPASPAPDWRP